MIKLDIKRSYELTFGRTYRRITIDGNTTNHAHVRSIPKLQKFITDNIWLKTGIRLGFINRRRVRSLIKNNFSGVITLRTLFGKIVTLHVTSHESD